MAWASVVLCLTALTAVAYWRWADAARKPIVVHLGSARPRANDVLALPPPDLLRPLTPEEAVVENADRPTSARPDSPARPFRAQFDDDESKARAIDCMAQAIYYEAAAEPIEGRRAVAQVVLNRVRHPGYPSSICGVVYQGSERSTGCQFTFTCDGSLRRQPIAALWAEARQVASKALAGAVFGPVGHATSYHADYVVPYWADSLDKEIQIGRHIFYRLKGGLGDARAFSQGYAGREAAPLTPTDVQLAATVIESAADAEDAADATETAAAPAKPKVPPILADEAHGKLLIDETSTGSLFGPDSAVPTQATPPAAPRPTDCVPAAGSSTRAAPVDNRVGRSLSSGCR